jgi:alkylation response protein AidB-like acyl-CoA dehydrogenase
LREVQELAEQFETHAEATDTGGPGNALLEQNVRALARIGFYGSRIDPAYGGLGLSGFVSAECHELIAGACGVTAFTQQQLHSGGGYVGQSDDDELKRELLPKFAGGELLCGIAFSHLRRPGPPMVTVNAVDGGYVINGEAPWVTGWRFLDSFALGGVAPDGTVIYSYISIKDHPKTLTVSDPVRVATMDAGDTVRVFMKDLFVPTKLKLFERDADYMKRSDFSNIAGPIQMPLGCARGCARQLRKLGEQRGRKVFVDAADHFDAEVRRVRDLAQEWNSARSGEPDYKPNALRARAAAIHLAARASEACVAANGGGAHLLTNPAQRRHREASFYATVAQTPDTQAALLEAVTYGG